MGWLNPRLTRGPQRPYFSCFFRSLAEITQRDREDPGAKFAIDADEAVLVDHFGALVGPEATDHALDIVEIAAAALGQRHGVEDPHLLLMEQAPERAFQRKLRVGELIALDRLGKDADMLPFGMVEPRMQALPPLLARRQVLDEDAAGDMAGIADCEPDDAR